MIELPVCRWRGAETRPGRVRCDSAKVHAPAAGVPVELCARCSLANHDPPAPPDRFSLVAPLGRKWSDERRINYSVTVAIPHLNTLDELKLAVELWRYQTARPYFIIVDTGSPWKVVEQLEAMRADDLEVHYIRGDGYCHSSDPVAAAMDLAFTRVRGSFCLSTHADVFPRRRDFLAWMIAQCGDGRTTQEGRPTWPVVGWEMSPRPGTDLWRGVVSHTATVWHVPTMRRIGLQWSLERYYDMTRRAFTPTVGWPDTESGPAECLRRSWIIPKILGPEPNFELHRTEWFDHARSITGARAGYANADLARRIEEYAAHAVAEARTRLDEWSGRARADRPPCLHLGRRVEGPDTVRDWRQCGRGHGIVCPCGVCKSCGDYEPDA